MFFEIMNNTAIIYVQVLCTYEFQFHLDKHLEVGWLYVQTHKNLPNVFQNDCTI